MQKRDLDLYMKKHPFTSLNDAVYLLMKDNIIRLLIAPNTILNESSLAAELGVSRTPVRNAIKRLTDENLILADESMPYVAPLEKNEISKLIEVRVAIETYAAYIAAARISASELDKLDQLRKKYHESYERWDLNGLVYYDVEYHEVIIKASHNNILYDTFQTVAPRLLHYRHFNNYNTVGEKLRAVYNTSDRQHTSIYNAIRLGFCDIAREEMLRNVNQMQEIISAW